VWLGLAVLIIGASCGDTGSAVDRGTSNDPSRQPEQGFVGRWVETEYSGAWPEGVTIEEEGDHHLWIDDDGTFLAQIDDEGILVIDVGIGTASAVLGDNEMISRYFGEETRFRPETTEDLDRQAAQDVPAACDVVPATPIEDIFGEDHVKEDRGQSCYFRFRGSFDSLELTVAASSLDEWTARWEGRCESQFVGDFSNGVLCESLSSDSRQVRVGWLGAYWTRGLSVIVDVCMPSQGAMRLAALEAVLVALDLSGGSPQSDDAIVGGFSSSLSVCNS
jgi:hypothetical protein